MYSNNEVENYEVLSDKMRTIFNMRWAGSEESHIIFSVNYNTT